MFNIFKRMLSGDDETSDNIAKDIRRESIADYADRDKILQMQYTESVNDIVQCNYCEVLYNKDNEILGAIIGDGDCYKLLSSDCYIIAEKYDKLISNGNYCTTVDVQLAEVIADKNDSDSYTEVNLTNVYKELYKEVDSTEYSYYSDARIASMFRHLVWKDSDTECNTVYHIDIKMKNKTVSMFIDHSTVLKLILNGILVKPELKYFINIGLAVDNNIIDFDNRVPKAKSSSQALSRLIDIFNKLPNKQTSNVKYFIDGTGIFLKSAGSEYIRNNSSYTITAKYIGLDGVTLGYRLMDVYNSYHSDMSKDNLIELMNGVDEEMYTGVDKDIEICFKNAELKDDDIVLNDDTATELEVYIKCNEVYIDDVRKYDMYDEEVVENGLNKKQLKSRHAFDSQECNALYKIGFKDVLGETKEILCNDSEVHSIIQSINIDGLSLNDSGTITINAEKLNYSNFELVERAFENRDYAVLSDLLVHTVLMKRISGR